MCCHDRGGREGRLVAPFPPPPICMCVSLRSPLRGKWVHILAGLGCYGPRVHLRFDPVIARGLFLCIVVRRLTVPPVLMSCPVPRPSPVRGTAHACSQAALEEHKQAQQRMMAVLPEPPMVRESLKREISFFVETLQSKGAEVQKGGHAADIIDYALDKATGKHGDHHR